VVVVPVTDWVTVPQAAEYTGFSTRTIRQRIHDGDLAAYMPRGSNELRIDRADLDDMIRQGRRESLAAQIRRIIAERGDGWPEPTDEQIREIARLLPRPAVSANADGPA
jgi:excisionase family DNA binding protein